MLNTFRQVRVRDPVGPDADSVNPARRHELLALFGEDASVEDQFGVFKVRTVRLENVVPCRTFYT